MCPDALFQAFESAVVGGSLSWKATDSWGCRGQCGAPFLPKFRGEGRVLNWRPSAVSILQMIFQKIELFVNI